MDLGCIDMGCIEKQSDEAFLDSENSTNGSGHSNSKNRKMQRKNTLRKSSPMNWFPRKKVDSFLKRKIKQLQEVGGMNSTLDETLGDSNPHYSRVLREKIAVSEAAHKAMEARKAAMVEASWCRILRAARIQSKDAEALLLEAEKTAAEAFEAAASIGVIMYDKPDCPRKDYEIDTSEKSTSAALTVTASFETAFEVDKQVAAAVKSAFVKLASCPSINKEEFKELLRKISEHPDIDEGNQDLSELSSECESDTAAEFDCSQDLSLNYEKSVGEVRERKYKKKQPFQKFNTTRLVDMMLERLRCLQEDELASLAIIVATCGLNAALMEAENFKQPDLGSASDYTSARALGRISSVGGRTRKQFEAELPSLDKFLVKRLTKLEREVLEAKNAKMNDKEIEEMEGNIPNTCETGAMKLERSRTHNGVMRNMKQDVTDIPSLDKFLVKHVSKLERAVQEAKSRRDFEATEGAVKVSDFNKKSTLADERTTPLCCDREPMGKENIDLNKKGDGGLATMKKESSIISKIHMQTILEAPETVSLQDGKNERNVIGNSLEKEKLGVSHDGIHRYQKNNGGTTSVGDFESLDKVLVKHVSKLEKEKMAVGSKEDPVRVKKRRDPNTLSDTNEGSLDQILVKHKSRLEKEKIAAAQQPDDWMTHSVSRREARAREMQEAWGGIDLGNSMRPHISGLERDKLKRKDPNSESEDTRLDQILVKRTSRIEKEKIAAAQQHDDRMTHFVSRREERDREMREAWGGIGLDNSMRPHISGLELDKLKRMDPNKESEDTGEDTSLDQVLHISGLERDKLKRMDPNRESEDISLDQNLHISEFGRDKLKRMDPNRETDSGLERDKLNRMDPNKESEDTSLDQNLHISGLGRDKLKRMNPRRESEDTSLDQNLHISGLGRDKLKRMNPRRESEDTSLDQNLHISGLGRDKLKRIDPNRESEHTSLDQILVKHMSRLEKEKIAAAAQQPDDQIRHSVSRREARERELQQAWGGLSFGNSLHPHVSRLERDKAAWLKAEEEERRKAMEV